MNWGKWIVLSFVLFTIFIGTLVMVCVRQDISLVSKDYYKDELNYGAQMERVRNTLSLVDKPSFKIASDQVLTINFSRFDQVEKGIVIVYSPENDKLDRKFTLNALTSQSTQSFSLKNMKSGRYKVQINWTMQGKEYYYEDFIFV